MGQMIQDSGWRIPDALWEQMVVLLPPRPSHPLGWHNPRIPDRAAMDGIFFVLRTGSQWSALSATGICSKSSAHRRFTEWVEAGVFHEFWRQGLLSYDALVGIDWEWLSADGAMTVCCTVEEEAKEPPFPAVDQATRTEFGRPRSSIRLRAAAAMATSVARASSLWKRSPSPMTCFQRANWPSTRALSL
jgi:transposase